MQARHRSTWVLALLSSLALLLAACGGGDGADTSSTGDSESAPAEETEANAPEASEPSEEESETGTQEGAGGAVDLSGAEFTVGSKEFTEQLILGQMTIQLLEDAGASVTDQTGLVGSGTVREALIADEIDMYWEYTGTGWITHLGNTEPVVGEMEQYEAVRDADEANDIVWLEPAPFNNTYAIAASNEKAEELGLTTLSDLATYLEENPDQGTLCAAAEFLGRDDGLPGLEEAYGFDFADDAISELELGLVYPSVDEADPCNFGEVFATDGRVAALGLTVLEDDEQFFASYLPSLNVRSEVLEEHPGLEELFAPLSEALDNQTMQDLNAQVDVEGEDPADVARTFLEEQGLLGG